MQNDDRAAEPESGPAQMQALTLAPGAIDERRDRSLIFGSRARPGKDDGNCRAGHAS